MPYSCNIIQVADRHGKQKARQTLNGNEFLDGRKSFENFLKKMLTS